MISGIFARDEKNGIGSRNRLPWHLKSDLAFFKKTTIGHTVYMGRRTHDSHPIGFPDRKNVIITSQVSNYEYAHSVEDFTKLLSTKSITDGFIIGGAQLFSLAEQYIDRWYITDIDIDANCDVFYDPDLTNFKLVSENKCNDNGINLIFREYMRV